MIIRRVLFLVLLSFTASAGFCQTFDPFEGQAATYHARMELFFPSPATEINSRNLLLDSVKQFEQNTNWTIANLKTHLDNYQQLQRSLQRHYQYFRILAEKNRKDSTAKTARDEMAQQLDLCSAKVDSILQCPRFAKLNNNIIKANGLLPYAYLLRQEHERAAHSLTPAEQKANTAAQLTIDHLTDEYDDLIDTIKPGKDKTASLRNYAHHGEEFAHILIGITKIKQSQALSRNYTDAPAQYYADRLQLSEDTVKTVFQKVALSIKTLQEYQQLPAGSVLHWKAMLFSDVRTLVNSALTPLGDNYQNHFQHLLDPANGGLDIAYTADRASGGNSYGTSGTPIGLYMQRFDGGFANLSTLIHEGGHAINRQLMSDNKVIPSYASGPNFVSEAIAMLNELLLFDELKLRAKTNAEKATYSRIFADKLAREIFTSAEEGTFEQQLYDGVNTGKITSVHDINALYAGIMRGYDPNFDQIPERQNEWISKRLVFDDALYNANYLFAILVTCKLYTLQQQDPQHFAAKYQALLSEGFDAPAAELLKKHFNIKLNYSELLKDALGLLARKSAEVKQLSQ